MLNDYAVKDALALAELVRRREVSALELCEEAIRRIERTNPRLNAVVMPMYDEARRVAAAAAWPAEAPFGGVPFLLKNLGAAYAGQPLDEGSLFFAGRTPLHDSEIVARHRRAGLVVVGRSNAPELGLVPYTEPRLHGPTSTPWKAGHAAGGSSGGAGAAVAAGLVPMAHGGDGGGSLRIPASCCGVFALKPTRGRTPLGPDRGESWGGLVVDHAVTRSVRDSAALLDATAGADAGAPYVAPPPARPFLAEVSAPPGRLRVAVTKIPHLPGAVHPDCAAAVDDAAKLLAELGHDVEIADPDVDAEAFGRDFFLTVCAETAAAIALGETLMGRRARRADFETPTWMCNLIGRLHRAGAAAAARARLLLLARQLAPFFARYDVLLSPTLAAPPPPHGGLAPRGAEAFAQEVIARARLHFVLRLPGVFDASVRRVFAFIPFTPLANVTGQPAMSLPLHWNAEGLPIGVMVTGRFGDEATLFRLAAQLEAARPWAGRRPPLHADAA